MSSLPLFNQGGSLEKKIRIKQPNEKVSKQKGYNIKGRRLKSVSKSLSKMTIFQGGHCTLRV